MSGLVRYWCHLLGIWCGWLLKEHCFCFCIAWSCTPDKCGMRTVKYQHGFVSEKCGKKPQLAWWNRDIVGNFLVRKIRYSHRITINSHQPGIAGQDVCGKLRKQQRKLVTRFLPFKVQWIKKNWIRQQCGNVQHFHMKRVQSPQTFLLMRRSI